MGRWLILLRALPVACTQPIAQAAPTPTAPANKVWFRNQLISGQGAFTFLTRSPQISAHRALLDGAGKTTTVECIEGLRRPDDVMGLRVAVTGSGNLLNAVVSRLAQYEIIARDLRVEQTTLDDAFVALTGAAR